MFNLIRGEIYKLSKDGGVKISLLITIIASIIVTLILKYQAYLGGNTGSDFTGVTVFKSLATQSLFQNFLFSILGAEFVAKDFEKSTINKSFSYGYSRGNIILSKFLIFYFATFIMMMIFITIPTVVISITGGFASTISFSLIIDVIRAIIISGICSIATASITAMIAVISSNVVITIVSSVGLYVSDMIINFISRDISNVLPFNIGGMAVSSSRIDTTICAIISSVVTIFITMAAGIYYFKGKDIK